jgi:hypothetical protein
VDEPELQEAMAELPNKVHELWQESMKEQSFRPQFSIRQMFVLMTLSAVLLAMIRLLGGPAATASVLGLVALFGLVIYACGYEPPHTFVLGWWLILAMYVMAILLGAVWSSFA